MGVTSASLSNGYFKAWEKGDIDWSLGSWVGMTTPFWLYFKSVEDSWGIVKLDGQSFNLVDQ